MGIFDKRMNQQGAITGMIGGILLMLFYMAKYKLMWFGVTTADEWWFGISPEGFGTIAMLFNAVLAFTVSRLTPAPPSEIQEMVESIRYPKGATEAVGVH